MFIPPRPNPVVSIIPTSGRNPGSVAHSNAFRPSWSMLVPRALAGPRQVEAIEPVQERPARNAQELCSLGLIAVCTLQRVADRVGVQDLTLAGDGTFRAYGIGGDRFAAEDAGVGLVAGLDVTRFDAVAAG